MDQQLEQKISKHIRMLRAGESLSQGEFGRKAGLHPRVISSMEDGSSLTIKNMQAIADAYNLPLSELIKAAEQVEL